MKYYVGLGVVVLVLLAWFFRYSHEPHPGIGGGAYVLDRWTGTIYQCSIVGCSPFPNRPYQTSIERGRL
jgi:hypothetical protein